VQDEFTPLHIGSRNGYLEVVKALLEKGADVNAKITVSITRAGLAKVGDVGENALVGGKENL
jgi:ankyrin repeat protein